MTDVRGDYRTCCLDDASLWKPKKIDTTLTRDLAHGWLIPALLTIEGAAWGRWEYWADLTLAGHLGDKPIPQIDLLGRSDPRVLKMLDTCLNCIPRGHGWQTWSSFEYYRYFLEWLLYGFGHPGQPEAPKEPGGCAGASNRLYQAFDLGQMLMCPYDYLGDICAEMRYGQHLGFYPTPMDVCRMMTLMVIGQGEGEDLRDKTFMDPCVGTGRFPIFVSNHMLQLYCMDISREMVQSTLVNGYMYAPWLVRPIQWLDARPDAVTLGNALMEAAPAHAQGYLAGSVPDPDQLKFLPIVKRMKAEGEITPDLFKVYETKGRK